MSPEIRQIRRFCIVEYSPEEYTRHYIVEALFRLMNEYEYEKIAVTDIAKKAGVGRATFYRYFKSKEDVITFYFEHTKKGFVFSQRYFPRCREDHLQVVKDVLTLFKENKKPLSLLRRARLDNLYLNYLNENFVSSFRQDYPDKNPFTPYLYAGMLFNVSMAWLESDCAEPIDSLAELIINTIY